VVASGLCLAGRVVEEVVEEVSVAELAEAQVEVLVLELVEELEVSAQVLVLTWLCSQCRAICILLERVLFQS